MVSLCPTCGTQKKFSFVFTFVRVQLEHLSYSNPPSTHRWLDLSFHISFLPVEGMPASENSIAVVDISSVAVVS